MQESPAFRAGIIYGQLNTFSRVIPTVDIAIIHRGIPKVIGAYRDEFGNAQEKFSNGIELLLAKRADELGWRFPGGHAMGKDKPENHNYEADANMESFEETSSTPSNLKYIGSTIINDWRYNNTPESIKTIFFLGEVMTLSTIGGDDIATTQFFPIEKVNEDMFEPEHKVLWKMLSEYLEVIDTIKPDLLMNHIYGSILHCKWRVGKWQEYFSNKIQEKLEG